MIRLRPGFSTVEALIALLILAMMGATLSSVHHQSIDRVAVASRELAATRALEAIAVRLGAEIPLVVGQHAGRIAHGFAWSVDINRLGYGEAARLMVAEIEVSAPDVRRSATVLRRSSE